MKVLPFAQIGFRDQGNDEWWCNLCGGESMDGRIVESDPQHGNTCVSCGAKFNGRRWVIKCCICNRELGSEDARQIHSAKHGTVAFCEADYSAGVDIWLDNVAKYLGREAMK